MGTRWLSARNIKNTAIVTTSAMLIAVPFITSLEGEKLAAYLDTAKVWTICSGETQGVQPADFKTREQCRELTRTRVGQFMNGVAASLKVQLPPKSLAAHTSFAYNIGLAGYRRSVALKLTNESDFIKGCEAMMNWHTAGGKDCRIRSNKCYGLINRRETEVKLCKEGFEDDN